MVTIQLTETELKIVKEALTNNAVRYSYEATVMEEEGVDLDWAESLRQKSGDMIELVNKIVDANK